MTFANIIKNRIIAIINTKKRESLQAALFFELTVFSIRFHPTQSPPDKPKALSPRKPQTPGGPRQSASHRSSPQSANLLPGNVNLHMLIIMGSLHASGNSTGHLRLAYHPYMVGSIALQYGLKELWSVAVEIELAHQGSLILIIIIHSVIEVSTT